MFGDAGDGGTNAGKGEKGVKRESFGKTSPIKARKRTRKELKKETSPTRENREASRKDRQVGGEKLKKWSASYRGVEVKARTWKKTVRPESQTLS